MDIKAKLLTIVDDYVDIDAAHIDTSKPLKFACGINSFVMLAMVSAIEEEFDVRIPDEKLYEFKTLDDIIEFLEKTCEQS